MLASMVRLFVIALVITGLVNVGIPRSHAFQRPNLKSDTQIKSEARLYETAILEIGRIETLGLKTADEFTRAKSIVHQHGPNLKFIRSRLVSLALTDSTLISAARARTNTTKLAEEFAMDLAQNSESIFKLSGGATVKDKISRSYTNDVTLLLRVAEKLKRAASEFKGHHAVVKLPHNATPQRVEAAVTVLASVVVASLILSAVMIACPPLGLALYLLSAAALGVVFTAGYAVVSGAIIAGTNALLARVAAEVGVDVGSDKSAECLATAESIRTTCEAEDPLARALGVCLAEFLLRAAACAFIP